jgi:hypothetical protein
MRQASIAAHAKPPRCEEMDTEQSNENYFCSALLIITTIFVVADHSNQPSVIQRSPHFWVHEKTFWETARD